MDKLKKNWMDLSGKYTADSALQENMFREICEAYSEEGRFYHTLQHITAILNTIEEFSSSIKNKDAMLFTCWYHDIVYNTYRTDNEEQSAVLGAEALNKLSVPGSMIQDIISLIHQTKAHGEMRERTFDEKLFLDADLRILGESNKLYVKYAEAVRKEYSQYPDEAYNKGRKHVLETFLQQPYIYKTDEFRERFEKQARFNISLEIKRLSV